MKAGMSIPVDSAPAEPRLQIGGFGRVNNDLKAFAGSRWDEIAREQVVLCPGYLERVLAAPITFAQPLSADRVRYIEQVSSCAALASEINERIQLRLLTVLAGKSKTMERPCRRISTMCGPMAARSRAEKRA